MQRVRCAGTRLGALQIGAARIGADPLVAAVARS